MTTRTSIARLADCAPVAAPESWPSRPPPRFQSSLHLAMEELETIFMSNMARRDADAATYGEPREPHEFYRGRE